eukprot:tig00021462_g21592.t1
MGLVAESAALMSEAEASAACAHLEAAGDPLAAVLCRALRDSAFSANPCSAAEVRAWVEEASLARDAAELEETRPPRPRRRVPNPDGLLPTPAQPTAVAHAPAPAPAPRAKPTRPYRPPGGPLHGPAVVLRGGPEEE